MRPVDPASRRSTAFAISLALLLALAACDAAPTGTGGSNPSTPGSPSPTEVTTDQPSPTGSGTADPTDEAGGVIPGLTATEVTTLLEGAGLTCADADTDSGVEYECENVADDFRNTVVVRGTSPDAVTSVDVTALGFGGDFVAREFLPVVAALPCDGCDPAAASEWVTENYDAGGEATVGPLRLALSGDASEKVLRITASE